MGCPPTPSKIVKEHTSKNSDWLEVHRLPAYAPELNPVEYLWSSTKGKDVANFCSDAFYEVEHKVRQAAHRIGCQEETIRGFLVASTLYDHSILVTRKTETH
jgi:transposase